MPAPTPPPADLETDRELLDPLADAGTAPAAALGRASLLQRLAAIPPNFFAIPFGIAGLAGCWRAAEPIVGVPTGVADALLALSAGVWALLVLGLAVRFARTPGAAAAEWRDPVLAPYLATPGIIALLLAAGVYGHAPALGRVLALMALVVVTVLGGALAGQWIAGSVDRDRLHPGYFLPTVAGGFVGADVMAGMGYRTLALLSFGIGAVCWLQLGSVILNRLVLGPPLAAALVPTLAIEVAPPAVAGNAYLALGPASGDLLLDGLTGFCVLSVVVQLRLAPLFWRVPFSAAYWAFTFSYTSVATFALHWLAREDPASAPALAWVLLAVMTTFVGAIAVGSVRAIVAQRFFPGFTSFEARR